MTARNSRRVIYRQTDEAVSASSSSNLSHLQAPSMSAALLRRGSDSSLPNFWGKSIDSATDEEDLAARRDSSSATMDTERRGSRLMEFLEKRNKKADRKRYKDKQGK